MFWFWWILQFQYAILFPTSNVHELIHPFSPIWDTMQDWIWIIMWNSYVCSKAIQWNEWINPSMQNSQLFVAPWEDSRKKKCFTFQPESVFDVFWCSKVVKSTVFYGDICHLEKIGGWALEKTWGKAAKQTINDDSILLRNPRLKQTSQYFLSKLLGSPNNCSKSGMLIKKSLENWRNGGGRIEKTCNHGRWP